MQATISQILLPLTLAAIMFGMGLNLQLTDFRRIFIQPKSMVLGLMLQLFALPLLALCVLLLIPLSPIAAAGLFLVSLCPGGATSNLFSYLSKGDVALSVSLTALSSLIVPFTLPIFFTLYLELQSGQATAFQLPLLPTIKQLVIVTLVPVLLGMLIRHRYELFAEHIQVIWNRLATLAMISIVIALIVTSPKVLAALMSFTTTAILILCCAGFLTGILGAKLFGLPSATKRTLAVEVGVQNAGTAMMVALTILQQPELAFVPLMYGLLMNLPAFAFVIWSLRPSREGRIAYQK